MRRRISILAAVSLLSFTGCKGADGAVGPQGATGATGQQGAAGPAGPIGAPGQGTRASFTGVLSAGGTNFADLSAAAGTITAPPTYACYLEFQTGGAFLWLQTGQPGNAAAICAIGNIPGSAALRVVVSGGVANQPYSIVVVY